jgi:hypothetical protein
MLTKAQESSLEMKLSLLLRDEAEIHVRELRTEDRTGRAVIVFYVEQKNGKGVLPGPTVVARLKEKLLQDSGLLELSVANIQTVICQNNCSGAWNVGTVWISLQPAYQKFPVTQGCIHKMSYTVKHFFCVM